jgi:hypothetical protein
MSGFQSKRQMTNNDPSVSPHRLKSFRVVDSAIVDDAVWYTVRVYRHPCRNWLRETKADLRWEHPHEGPHGTYFDIHEKLYTMLALRWPE